MTEEAGGGLHGYGFVLTCDGDPASFVRRAVDVDGVRYAARAVGDSLAFVAATVPDLATLQDGVLPGVREAGATRVEWSVAPRVDQVAMLLRPPKFLVAAFTALVSVRTGEPVELLAQVADTFAGLDERDGFGVGGASVTGRRADVLVDLGAPDEQSLLDLVVRLRELPGVQRSSTLLVRAEGNEVRGAAGS